MERYSLQLSASEAMTSGIIKRENMASNSCSQSAKQQTATLGQVRSVLQLMQASANQNNH